MPYRFSLILRLCAVFCMVAATSLFGQTTSGEEPAFVVPSIEGTLFPLGDASISPTDAHLQMGKDGGETVIAATFQTDRGAYPNIKFPLPPGGWNLDTFGHVEAQVTNTSEKKATVYMRVDNAGDEKESRWNTSSIKIEPGETETLKVTFGLNNNKNPGFPLDPSQVTGIQIFMIKPKQDVTLKIQGLRAAGSPDASANNNAGSFTTLEDRDKPVTPPEWLGQRPPVEGDWVQTLNENFDGDTLNTEIWRTDGSMKNPLPGALERNSAENIEVRDGILRLKAEKRSGRHHDLPDGGKREYTTGNVDTYDRWTQRYGYFESRMKLPTARGLWPAFWMMPDRGGDDIWWKRVSTHNGGMEIDIMEILCEWGRGRNNAAVHWDGYGKDHKSWGSSHLYFGPTPDDWHAFGLLWEPGKLTWYIDGKKVCEFEDEAVGTVPNYLILCIQMGRWATKDIDDASLPDYFEIDYVRAWQLSSRIDETNSVEG